jgi:hypothetical protein
MRAELMLSLLSRRGGSSLRVSPIYSSGAERHWWPFHWRLQGAGDRRWRVATAVRKWMSRLRGTPPPQADAGGAEVDVMAQADTLQADVGGVEAGVRCEAGAGPALSPDAAACFIDLNQYDRSCSVDPDCVSSVEVSCAVSTLVPNVYVRGGNFCDGCNCNTG